MRHRSRVPSRRVYRLHLREQSLRAPDAGTVCRGARAAPHESAQRCHAEHSAAQLPAGLPGVLRRLHASHGVFGRELVRFSGGAWLARHRTRARLSAVDAEERTAGQAVVDSFLPEPAVETAGETDARARTARSD